MSRQSTVDFTKPEQVVSLLRQRGAKLAKSASDDNVLTPDLVADLADAVAILMFVTAQGMERSVKPPEKQIQLVRSLH
ncbi:MAG: hypothetical protein DRI90_24385 [Deltaproteobacteria bacterium]|nr:MAG: hypothetical protein DRI90_24385 [Deltaproteobacteria bacterium]